jgi:mannose/fructose/N-acetylgalactosamine-specific phosphotransferase system component IIC
MKYVIRGALYNFLCIFVFAIIYYIIRREMDMNEDMSRYIEPTFSDTLFLATTIQAGVGYTLLTPKTELSKYIIMGQQFFMIFTNLMLFYFISL